MLPRATGAPLLKVAMVAAVAAVFALAYLDLRREQARALEDFTSEQATLARALAATVASRLDDAFGDLDALATLADATAAAAQLVRVRPLYREIDQIDD